MKKIFTLISGLLLSATAFSQVVVTIGTGVLGGTGLNYNPIYRSSAGSAFDYSRAFYLFTQAELAAAGIPAGATITQIEWDKSNAFGTITTTSNVVFNIFMKNSASTSYAAAQTWGTLNTGAIPVYTNNTQVIPAVAGFIPFSLTSPFIYTGSALEISTDWDISAVAGNPTTGGFSFNSTAAAGRVGGTSAGAPLTSASLMTTQANRPNIRITYTPPLPCAGPPNAGISVASNTSICSTQNINLFLSGSTSASGLTYQWQSSPNNTVWTSIPTGTTLSITESVSVTTYYQCVVSCGANTATSTPVAVFYGLTPSAGTTIATPTLVCPNQALSLSLAGSIASPGITYQWQSSPNNIAYSPISGQTLANTTQTITSNIYFQNVLTCGTATAASAPIQITIAGTTTNNVPYNEGFEGISINNQLPNCSWAASNLPVICQTYTATPPPTVYNRIPNTGLKFATFRYGTDAAGDYFYSNGIQLTAGTTYSASVFYIADGGAGWSQFSLSYATAQATTGLTQIASVSNIVNTTYNQLSGLFTVPVTGIYYIAVKAVGNSSPWYLTWDDLSVTAPPICSGAPAANSAVTSATSVCPNGSANLSLSTSYTTTGLTYQWYSAPAVSGPYTAITGATNTAYTATNIAANTFFQAVIVCTNGPASTTSTPVQVSVSGNPCQCNAYCSQVPTNINDDEIFNVTIGTLNNTSSCSQTGGPGSALNLYSNYTGIVAAPSLTAGSSYSLDVTVGQCNLTAYSGGVTVYMDFNNNGSFADPGEQVYASASTLWAVAGTLNSTVIAIPVTANPGITRMRVIAAESNVGIGACAAYSYGETEDYCINIVAGSGCSGAPGANTVTAVTSNICPNTTASLGLANSYTVGGLTYQWFSSPALSGPYTAVSGATLNTYVTASLTSNTFYQAVITCSNGPVSTTATPIQITVGGSPCQCAAYCPSQATSTADDEIFNVSIGTLNNTSSCATTGGPGSILNMYSNYAGIVAAPTLTAGFTYSLDVVVGQCGAGQYSGGVTVYMDFNNNGSFADPGEQVYASPTTLFATAGTTVSANITLPVTASAGTTRMRVIAVENGLNQLPCNNYTWGETEDYCINIVPAPPCTGASSGTIATTSYSVCSGQTISLVATGATIGTGITYNWQVGSNAFGPFTNVTGGNGATTTSYTTAPLTSGTSYYVLQTICSLASATAVSVPAATVVVNPTPAAGASTVAPICSGQNVAFTSTTDIGTGFSWTGPNVFTSTQQNPTIAAATSSASGNYTLLVSTPNCTAAPVIVNVVVNSTNLNIMASPPTLCTSGSSTLTAVGNATAVTWNTSATTTSIVVSPSSTTSYTVVGTGTSNCVATATTTVAVINPTITATGAAVCNPTTVATLSATAFGPVSWYATSTPTNPLATGNTFTATAATTTTYYAQANSTATGSLFTTIAAGNGASGNMFDIVPLNNIVISGVDMHISATTTQSVEVWYRLGSFVGFESSNVGWTQAFTTTVTGLGTGILTPVPGTFAINAVAGQTLGIFVTTNGGSVAYTNGTVLGNLYASNSDLQLFEGKGGGYFSVINSPRVFNGTLKYTKVGCTSPIIPVVITAGASPTITIASSQTSVCPGGTVNIGVTGANTYTWSTGANGALISPTVNATTNYSVVGESTPGCASTASISIAAGAVPSVSATSSASLICNGQTATLTASGANTYSWSTTSTNTSISVTPSITTSYTVTGTGANGCKNTFVVSQAVSPCTGINNNNVTFVNGILVYPNPNRGEFTIELNNGSFKNIELMDLTGRVIISDTSSNDKVDFNINTLANGVYYVRIQSNNTVEVIKIVKQ